MEANAQCLVSTIGTFTEWMSGSPHATSEGMIDVVTNIRIIFSKPKRKAGGIFSVGRADNYGSQKKYK